MARPQVKSTMVRGSSGQAIVSFTDGRKVVFTPNNGGLGDPVCNERITIQYGDIVLVAFNSKYQYPINRKPFGFARATKLSMDEIVTYLRGALERCEADSKAGKKLGVWRVVSLSVPDIREIENGRWALLG